MDYTNSDSRVIREKNDPNRHVSLVSTNSPDFSQARYIFLGAPVWWGELSWVIDSFVSENDFTGKTIIPFGTSASSPSFDLTNLKKLDTNGDWLEGKRFSSNVSSSEITAWIDSLPINR